MEIQVGDEDVNKVHDLAMEMIPGLTMKDKFQGRYPRTDPFFEIELRPRPSLNTCEKVQLNLLLLVTLLLRIYSNNLKNSSRPCQ